MKKNASSIQGKLMRLIMLICGAVLLVSCLSFFFYEFLTYRDITKQELATLGQITASNSTAPLAFMDPQVAEENLQTLKAQKHIVAALLYDSNGKVFAFYPATLKQPLPLLNRQKAGYRYGENFIEGFQPVVLGDRRLGTLYLKSDTQGVYDRFVAYGAIALGFFLVAILFAFLLSRRMQRSISQPILHLAEKAKLVSERRDYSVRADKKSQDELGLLTDAFNHMLSQIEAQNAEIKTLNANLEERIGLRTFELQQANAALTEQNDFIQTIIDASVDLIAVFDKDLNYLIVNNHAANVFQRSREEMIGKNILDVFPNLYGKPVIDYLQRALDGEFVHVEAYSSEVADAHFENFFIPLFDNDHSVDRVLLIGHDITNIMKANEKLRQLNTELEKSNRDLEQFAYVASHDLQEPLRKIMTFSDLSERNVQNPQVQRRYLEKISSSASRMTELIKAVLNYSRISRTEREFADVDLNAIVEQIKVDLELSIQEKGAVIRCEPLPVVKGIPHQLSQLFLNLFTNALKFTEQSPVITIGSMPLNAADQVDIPGLRSESEYVVVRFSDNGIGFEPQYADKIFSIFQRLHSPDKYSGTGIGLAVCKKIVENHNGIIRVETRLGAGSSFLLYFPYDLKIQLTGTKAIGQGA